MRGIGFSLLLALTACASTPAIKTVMVDRPIPIVQKCVKASDIPVRPKTLKEEGLPLDLEKALSIALAKISEWTRYGHQTDTILSGCTS